MSRNILVISYYFPPTPGVGGRRWAKFVKYLSKDPSTNIFVVSCTNTVKEKVSSYGDDLKGVDFKHIFFSPRYPLYMQNMEFPRRTIIARIGFRFQRLATMLLAKGNYYDYTVFWKSYFKNEVPALINKNNIDTIIISGPPFRYVYYCLEIKKKYNNVQIVLDCRDPWCDPNHPPVMSLRRHNFESGAEKIVLESVDKILAVSNFQKKMLEQKSDSIAPVFVLRNGLDLSDIPTNLEKKNPDDTTIRIAHFGVMHATKDYYWMPFVEAIKILKTRKPELFERLELDFIGLCPEIVLTALRKTGVKVNAFGLMDIDNAYRKLNLADIVLWFKYDGSAGDFATKFGDYIALKKFIWTFSVEGEVTEHIEENEIGKVFYRSDPHLEETILNEMLQLDNPDLRIFDVNYKAESLELTSLTKSLFDILYPG